MADPNDIRKERSFPEIPGVPNRNELMKPLIFPNSQRAFKLFTYAVTIGQYILCKGAGRIRISAFSYSVLSCVLAISSPSFMPAPKYHAQDALTKQHIVIGPSGVQGGITSNFQIAQVRSPCTASLPLPPKKLGREDSV